MEEEQQETKFCSNCKKDIPANNFLMHVPHCQRNITLCEHCQEPVPKSQLDEHFEEYHAKVKCECGESMEKMHLDEHKENDCKSRKTTCDYCNLECTVGEIDSHKEYCGSRTELCDKCNQRIQHRDLEEHLLSDCTLNNNEPTANNNASNASGGLQNGFSRTLPAAMVRNFGFGDIDIALAGGHDAFHRLITSGFGTLPVGDKFEQDQLFDNRNYMSSSNLYPRSNVVARGPTNSRRPRDQGRDRNNQFMDNRMRSDNSVAARPDLENDELLATLLACEDNGSLMDGSYAGFKEPLPGINHLHDDHNTEDEEDQDEDLDETMLPCEFCGKPIKAQDLIQHQTGCQLVSSGSPSLFPQLRSQPRSLPPIDPPDPYSDDEEEHNGTIEPHDETFLPCEFCQELFPSDSLIGHQSICEPDGSRPPSISHTFHGAFFASDQHGLNNSAPQTKTRPPRPSRPVVVSDSSDEQNLDLFNPISDVRSSRRVTSNDEGRSALFNPAGEIVPLRETYSNDDDNRSNNNNNNNSSRSNNTSNNSRSSLASGNSRSQRNNEVRSRHLGSPSHSVPLTVRNGQASQIAMNNQGNRTTTTRYLSQPSRVTSDNEREERVGTASSRYVESCSGVQESGKSSLNNGNEVSAFRVNGRYRNGTRREETEDEPHLEMRPLQETGATPFASANQRPPRKGVSSGGHTFQHTTETRKQMSRLAPCFDNPSRSTDSRKDGSKNQPRLKDKKIASSGRSEQRTSAPERAAQSTSGRPSSSTKPKTKKKIV